MENNLTAAEEFKAFADKEIKNHLAELNTHYQNRATGAEELAEAYKKHSEILSKELDDKIKQMSLTGESNEQLKAELNGLKQDYIRRLKDSNQSN